MVPPRIFVHCSATLRSCPCCWSGRLSPGCSPALSPLAKCAEEARPGFSGPRFSSRDFIDDLCRPGFFLGCHLCCLLCRALAKPQEQSAVPTALAFERALHAHWIVDLIMASALVALLQAFNANVVASSRLLFAMEGETCSIKGWRECIPRIRRPRRPSSP